MRRETFDTPGPLELNVRVPIGDVDLETVEGNETVVEISASPEIEEAARIELRPKRDGHELSVVIEKRSGFLRSFREDVRVQISSPPGADVDLSTASADVEARGDFGAAKVNTASGDIRFEHIGGDAQVNSASGDVNLDQIDGVLTVNTASGDVEIRRIQGDAKVRAASGDIEVGIRQGSKLWIDARSMSGETSSELELGDAPTDGEGPLVEVRATAMSGDIKVKRA